MNEERRLSQRLSRRSLARLIRERRSTRSFLSDSIPDEDLDFVLDAGRWAPSAGNTQPWIFFVVRSFEVKEKLATAALGQRFLADAPLVIAVCADLSRAQAAYGQRGANLYCIQDTAAAVQNMLLAAQDLGLGACWVGAFDEEEVRAVLALSPDMRPVALVPLGRSAQRHCAGQRRPLSEIVRIID